MNLIKLFEDENELITQIEKFFKNNQIEKISENKSLVKAHIEKAKHNLQFFAKNLNDEQYTDWLIVILYYTIYHCALALLANKRYTSKNHTATILLLIKEYSISKEEVELITELSINKDDAELYTNLKSDRHDASYSTNSKFNIGIVKKYQKEVITFMQKTEEIINS